MQRLGYHEINEDTSTADVVKKNFRTASVLKRYGIEYCCGIRLSLKQACEIKGLPFDQVLQEIREAAAVVCLPSSLPFREWKTDFLADYIINVHHHYLRESLPLIKEHLTHFVSEHSKKFPQLNELQIEFNSLEKAIVPHLDQEEQIIFPYIRQIAHAYESKEPYARLLVRTLRKPVEDIMQNEHTIMDKRLSRIRSITQNYTPPDAACIGHRLSYSLLRELDDDLIQHIHLENNILFPRAIVMERELLERN